MVKKKTSHNKYSHNLDATHGSRNGQLASLIKVPKKHVNVENLVSAFPTIVRKLLNSKEKGGGNNLV
jgi:hypothetical protein